MSPPLRLAALVDAGATPAWVSHALSVAVGIPGVHLAVVVTSSARAPTRPGRPPWAGRTCLAADRAWFRPSHPLHRPVPLDVGTGVPVVPWTSAAAFARLADAHGVDVLIDFTDGTASGEVLLPMGAWVPSHGGLTSEEAALASALNGVLCVRSVLRRADDPSQVLVESVSRVDHVSLSRVLNHFYWKNVELIGRGVRRLQRERTAAPRTPSAARVAPLRAVEARDLAWRVPRHITRALRARRTRRHHDSRWILLCGRREGHDIVDLKAMHPPRGHSWADPFVVADKGTRYVFFEDYRHDVARGHIAVATITQDGRLGPARPALERPYHLSYPFVFQHEGAWYMLPETQARRTVEVYRCDRLPDRWQFSHVLMDNVRAVDATLLAHEGRWWLFANIAEFEGSTTHDALFAFWADHPLSTNWRPHPANPVVADVRRARPAGPFMRVGGRLLRPSQDCGVEYGRAVCLNEVVTLTTTDFEERPVGTYQATWDPQIVAMHTLSEHEGLVLLDGKLRTPRGRTARRPSPATTCALVRVDGPADRMP